MISKRLQKAFLVCALLGTFLTSLSAAVLDTWGNGHTISNSRSVWSTSDTDVLALAGTITVSQDAYIGAMHNDLIVTATTSDVTIQPYNIHPKGVFDEWGHLVFYAALDKTITVSCSFDLVFTGSYGISTTHKNVDMIVTFSGQGTTRFRLADHNTNTNWRGAYVDFTGNARGGMDFGSLGAGANDTTVKFYAAGTRVNILMDETEAQVITNGHNKVVFERMDYYGTTNHTGFPNRVYVGPASYITYLSNDPTGTMDSFGAMAIDPTHNGAGRMVLEIDGDPNFIPGTSLKPTYNFNDGGLVVCGHFIPNFTETGIRRNTFLNSTAGKRAVFRVVDDLAYNVGIRSEYDPTDAQARGLLVINKNTTVPKLASDTYSDAFLGLNTYLYAYDYGWAKAPNNRHQVDWQNYGLYGVGHSMNVRTGFVLGVNGRMEIYHKTFCHHVSCFINDYDRFSRHDISHYGSGGLLAGSASAVMKRRNPSAFVVDGLLTNVGESLGTQYNYNYYWNNGIYYDTADVLATNYDPSRHAQLVFYGDSNLFLSSAAYGQFSNTTSVTVGGGFANSSTGYGPFFDDQLNLVYTFSIDSQTYDGSYISSSLTSTYEGSHVLDVQGLFETRSLGRASTPNRSLYSSAPVGGRPEEGTINAATVTIDYTGREYTGFGSGASYVTRPLTMTTQVYNVYNSPSLFINHPMEIYNSALNHNDVLKFPTPNPSITSPAIVGGDILLIPRYVWVASAGNVRRFEYGEYPKIKFFNSFLDMHESLVASGVRFVVHETLRDLDGTQASSKDNTSKFVFYDHGDQLDTLLDNHGRIFMLTSDKNLLINGLSAGVLENTYLNVYRDTYLTGTPDLSIRRDVEPGANRTDDYSMHLFLMSRCGYGSSYMSLGWTSTVGWSDVTAKPWAYTGSGHKEFSLDSRYPGAGTLSVDGNFIYFGGTDTSGNKKVTPVIASNEGSTIYVNHGGKITAGQPPYDFYDNPLPNWTLSGYDCFIDTVVATRLWADNTGLKGVVDLPKDQVFFGYGYGQQPYAVNTSLYGGNVRLNVHTVQSVTPVAERKSFDRPCGEEVTIPWNNRAFDSGFIPPIPKSVKTRYTAPASSITPIAMPNDLLYITAGDTITQLKVSGATMADPFCFLVTGDPTYHGYGRVYEFVSLSTNTPGYGAVWGEGPHADLYLNNGGRIGLGVRDWNEHSTKAWNIIGKDYITIHPDGDCTVDLNSDLIVADRLPLIPTSNFGSTLVGPNSDRSPRITFFSEDTHEIRIPAGQELDLSAFGQADSSVRQEIAFGGKVRLVFEAGSTLRFPSISDEENAYPALYMNDESEIIFEAPSEKSKARFANISDADAYKTKIKGCGQIWLNKNAKMSILGDAKVAVQSDADTKLTDIIVSIQRQGDFSIGDEQNAGGSFEVGNPTELDTESYKVNFRLLLNGPKARFHMDREGFLGLGVGVINKDGNPNADASIAYNPDVTLGLVTWLPSTKAWQVQSLYNVHKVIVTVTEGIIDHSNIFDGTDRRASLLAVGPLSTYANGVGSYSFELTDPTKSKVLGGANIMRLDSDSTALVNIWSYADSSARTDGTMYNILAAYPTILRSELLATDFPNSTIAATTLGGRSFVGTQADFFKYISQPEYPDMAVKNLPVGVTSFVNIVGYVWTSSDFPGVNIYRIQEPALIGNLTQDAVEEGVLMAASGSFRGPDNFVVRDRLGEV